MKTNCSIEPAIEPSDGISKEEVGTCSNAHSFTIDMQPIHLGSTNINSNTQTVPESLFRQYEQCILFNNPNTRRRLIEMPMEDFEDLLVV